MKWNILKKKKILRPTYRIVPGAFSCLFTGFFSRPGLSCCQSWLIMRHMTGGGHMWLWDHVKPESSWWKASKWPFTEGFFFVVVVPSVYETFISPERPPGIATQFPRQPGVFDCGCLIRWLKVTGATSCCLIVATWFLVGFFFFFFLCHLVGASFQLSVAQQGEEASFNLSTLCKWNVTVLRSSWLLCLQNSVSVLC